MHLFLRILYESYRASEILAVAASGFENFHNKNVCANSVFYKTKKYVVLKLVNSA